MTPIDIARLAVDAMTQPGTLGVTLVVPKGKMPKGFPRGELLNEMNRNGIVERAYSFNPERVLSYLARNRLIAMERINEKVIVVKPIEMSNEDEAQEN